MFKNPTLLACFVNFYFEGKRTLEMFPAHFTQITIDRVLCLSPVFKPLKITGMLSHLPIVGLFCLTG